MKLFKTFGCICVISLLLQGCIFVAGAAAGAAAIAVVYDHRKISSTLEDTKIAKRVYDRLQFVPQLRLESHIEVSVFNRVVLLTGETPSPGWRAQAEELARSTPGVARVYNQITIQGPTSPLTRTSDSWITAKIKGSMLATENLRSGSIKVQTENGIVYLMGSVTRAQAEIATDIARQVTGVQKVVKVFNYKN